MNPPVKLTQSKVLSDILDENFSPVARMRLFSRGVQTNNRLSKFQPATADKGCLACGNCIDACPVVREKKHFEFLQNKRTSMSLETIVGEDCRRCYKCVKACPQVSKETKEVVTKLKQIAPVVEALNKFNTIDTTTASGIEEGINAFDELAKVASSTEVDDKDLSEALDKIENASRTLTTAYRAALSGGAVDSNSMYDALSDLNDAQRTFNKTFSSTSNMVSLGNEADDAQFELVNYLIDRKEILEN